MCEVKCVRLSSRLKSPFRHRGEKVNFMCRLLYLIYSHITVSRPGCYCLLTFLELISVSGVRFNVLNINVDNKLFLHV